MIGHVDCDCFYASAERVRFAKLRGVPIAVLGNHGACIIAPSYEMKALGVKTGMPIWEALPLCPSGIYVKRDFRWYEVLTRMLLDILRSLSPTVEFYSVDEMFFEIGDPSLAFAKELQQRIKREMKVPVSIGIASSKTLAKLATKSVKPFGCGVVLNDADRWTLLKDRPVEHITGIARRRAITLAKHGILTCQQFAQADRALIRDLLTKTGEEYWWELNGDPVNKVQTSRAQHKFIARGGSIGRASIDQARVRGFVVRNVERLIEALYYYRVLCDKLILTLSFNDQPERSMRASMVGSTSDFEPLVSTALDLLGKVWQPTSSPVHYMHVIAGRLRPYGHRQRSLFELPKPKETIIAETKRLVNESVGRFALRSAATLPLNDVHADTANDYDITEIMGKTCF